MQDYPRTPQLSRSPQRRQKKRQSYLLLSVLLLLFFTVCAVALGYFAYRAGYGSIAQSANLTATVVGQNNASCQALIEKAMQVSKSSCNQIDSNKACYGNNTIKADLVPGTVQKFSTRGDIVDVDKVQRISASPLKLDSNEWGVAVLKVIANLPRSLPGQTVTMVVFGNTTLDNKSGNLETFFFSSELGKIVCEKVPDDGIMISVPEGTGVKFTVNGADLTLTGDASIKAAKNGKMVVSLFKGSGRIVSDGREKFFGAGQQVNVQLGGDNGTASVGPPSSPLPLSPGDLATACALTGQFCALDQITPVTSEQAQQMVQAALGITPIPTATNSLTPTFTPAVTQTFTPTETPIIFVTPTILILPTRMPTGTPTKVRTPTPAGLSFLGTTKGTKFPTITPTIKAAKTPTKTPTRTPTWTPTQTPTPTPTGTQTPTPTDTPTPTPIGTPTDTPTPTPTATTNPDPWSDPVCSGSQATAGTLTNGSGSSLRLNLTNNSGSTITIDALRVTWDTVTAVKFQQVELEGNQIGNPNDTTSPSVFPASDSFTGPVNDRRIGTGNTSQLRMNFQNNPNSGSYTVEVHFNIGCQVSASIP